MSRDPDEDVPTASDAIVGVHPWLHADRFPVLRSAVQTLPADVGPGRAGAYFFDPHANADGELVYFAVFHTERGQLEWLVGPDAVWEFTARVPFYLEVARVLYPGSARVDGSTADGAGQPPRALHTGDPLDRAIAQIDVRVAKASSREILETLQKARLALLLRRERPPWLPRT